MAELRRWVIQEEMARVGKRYRGDDFGTTQGYLLCLGNLVDLFGEIDRKFDHECDKVANSMPLAAD